MDSSMDSSIDPARLGGITIHVGEVPAVDDVELAQHRLPNGDYEIPVDGRDKLSTDKRIQPAEKLEAQSPNPCSRPLDLAEVDTLLQVSLDTSCTLRPESPTPPFDPMRCETEAYQNLVNDGGRPVYPISLIQEVYRDTKHYAEILWPWQRYKDSPDGIFQRQWRRWQDFRKWQNDNRDRDDDDDGFEAYVERTKQAIRRFSLPRHRKRLAEIEADPSCLKLEWDQRQSERQMQRSVKRDHDCRGFREYIEAAKRRLARHGIPPPYTLDEDPNKQDKLTTWLEYLNYEYWWLGVYARRIKRLGIEREKFWQELVDSELLKPDETKYFICIDESEKGREAEQNRARKAVQRETLNVEKVKSLTWEDAELSDIPEAERELMLERAEGELHDANQQLQQARERSRLISRFVCATKVYDLEKDGATRQYMVVQWIISQLSALRTENVASSDSKGRSTWTESQNC
ncbi:hypothetical protein NHJ13734_006645 [Beauveria thailandica]